ncbi:hypothetical protein [Streptomyces sp. 8N706]|uniref:hypothetical protein n=1 Tax=Streptomyces sp. 8N706 TaxID=3457416 RepID=UPI003FD3EFA7
MRQTAHSNDPARGERHHTRTDERGSFSIARCSCGWAGPARRARARAREDAAAHELPRMS